MVIAGEIEVALFFVSIVEGKGIWVELAPDDFRCLGVGRKVWQVHVVKQAGLDWSCEDVREDRRDPFRRARPIEFDFRFAVMGNRNPGPAMEHRFAHRGDCSRIMNIRAEIRAVINPAQDPVGVRNHLE